jgi:hypothetical protein
MLVIIAHSHNHMAIAGHRYVGYKYRARRLIHVSEASDDRRVGVGRYEKRTSLVL